MCVGGFFGAGIAMGGTTSRSRAFSGRSSRGATPEMRTWSTFTVSWPSISTWMKTPRPCSTWPVVFQSSSTSSDGWAEPPERRATTPSSSTPCARRACIGVDVTGTASATMGSPAGDPIVADAVPVTSTPMHARLAQGVELDGVVARLSGGSAQPSLDVELDWKTTGHVEHGLGVFIHVEIDGQDTVNVDHVRISGVAPLEDLPENALLRDVV